MPSARSRVRLLALLAVVVSAFGLVPIASATALSTVVEVGDTAGSLSPSTLTGSAGDTFQLHNAGVHAGQPGYYITIENGTGSVSLGGNTCSNSGICMIPDGATETVTILSTGTFWIDREAFGSTAIGTLTITAPAAPAPTTTTTTAAPAECASSNWNFGVVDYEQGGFGDQILVTWGMPTVCSGAVSAFVLNRLGAGGAATPVDASACQPSLQVATGSPAAQWSCALKVASVTGDSAEFQVVGTTTGGLVVKSRSVTWVRGAAPNADVSTPGTGVCNGAGAGRRSPARTAASGPSTRPVGNTPLNQAQASSSYSNPGLLCFIVSLVIQTEFASNGNQALTDKQVRELLNIGVAFSDTQSARAGRAAKWVSIGKKTITITKAGRLRVALPLSKQGVALLRKRSLKVRVTYTLTRGKATRQIVQYTTLPRIAS